MSADRCPTCGSDKKRSRKGPCWGGAGSDPWHDAAAGKAGGDKVRVKRTIAGDTELVVPPAEISPAHPVPSSASRDAAEIIRVNPDRQPSEPTDIYQGQRHTGERTHFVGDDCPREEVVPTEADSSLQLRTIRHGMHASESATPAPAAAMTGGGGGEPLVVFLPPPSAGQAAREAALKPIIDLIKNATTCVHGIALGEVCETCAEHCRRHP